MLPGCCRFLGLIVAAAHLSGLLNMAAPTRAETAQEHASLAGQLLVASPRMDSPVFSRTVIVVVRHDSQGAIGIIINRPIGERPLASLLKALGDETTAATGTVRVYRGGPVQPDIGLVIYTADYHSPQTIVIDQNIALTSSRTILRDIGSDHGPHKSLIAFGYAGWGPGQLEAEREQGFWFTTPEDPTLVFGANPDAIWDEAVKRRTQDL